MPVFQIIANAIALGVIAGWQSPAPGSVALNMVPSAQELRCIAARNRTDTSRYVYLTGPKRVDGTLRIWSERDGHLRFVQEWRNGMSLRSRSGDQDLMTVRGAICTDASGIKEVSATLARNAIVVDSESIVRVGDSLVAFRHGVRSSEPASSVFLLSSDWAPSDAVYPEVLRLLRPPNSPRLGVVRGMGSVRSSMVTTLSLPHGRALGALSLLALEADSGQLVLQWQDRRGNLVGSCLDGLIEVGYEQIMEELCAAEIRAVEPAMAAFARTIGARNPAGFAFVHAGVVDVERGVLRRGMSVLVEGNRITAIGVDGSIAIPKSATIIDVTGKTLAPGLWDMHRHLSLGWQAASAMFDRAQRYQLAHGVTAVRNHLADSLYAPWQAHRIDVGNSVGPRDFPSGAVDLWYPDEPLGNGLRSRLDVAGQVKDSAEVESLIQSYARHGFVWIKIYAMLPPDLVRVAIRAAHRHGMRVAGHIPINMTTNDALTAGYDEITHAAQAVRSLIPGGVGRPGAQAFLFANSERLDLDAPDTRALVNAFRESGASLEPTLCVAEPPRTAGSTGATKAALERRQAAFDKLVQFVRMLRDEHVPIGIGTDGCDLIREMELMRLVGFSNADVLRMATLDAARRMGQGHQLGSLVPGKLADIIVIDGDPLVQLGDLRRLAGVMKDGVYYDNLDALGERYPPLWRP
jgi:hypothetical protein